MSSQHRIEVQGQAPFKQSGVYEVQISVSDSKPSDDAVRRKQFSALWRGNFHLKVKDGLFSEKIGTSDNPLPSSIETLDSIWIIVTDLFSSLYSIFHVPLKKPSTQIRTEPQTKISEKPKTEQSPKPIVRSSSFPGDKGPTDH